MHQFFKIGIFAITKLLKPTKYIDGEHMEENKVYTKTGDGGFTSLISGKRVPKHNIRIKTYGTIDELIAWLGLIRDTTKLEGRSNYHSRNSKTIDDCCRSIIY